MSGNVTIGIVMGSASDKEVMQHTEEILKKFDVSFESKVLSAHRTPKQACEWVEGAKERGVKVIIAAAGMSAHLAGVSAAHTRLPVIGVPLSSPSFLGLDSLLSTVNMPKGTPVGTVSVGKAGAINAALFALRILAVADEELYSKLENYQLEMEKEVLQANS